jgi:hypothetical protein
MTGSCEFCFKPGVKRAGSEDGLEKDVFVCDGCWKLLKNPITALPLIRGNVTLSLRGKMSSKKLQEMVNHYMEDLSKWQPKN